MKKLISLLLFFAMVMTFAPIFSVASADGDLSSLLGEENEEAAFKMDISVPDLYFAGDKITVTVTVNDLNTSHGLQHVQGRLYFDPELFGFGFDLKVDKEIKNSFRGYNEWVGMSKLMLDADEKWYILVDAVTIGVEDEETGDFTFSDVPESGILVFDFTFNVKSDAKGDTAVFIPHSTVIGDFCDFDTNERIKYKGNGAAAIIGEGDIATRPTPDQPTPDQPDPDESSEPSEDRSEDPSEGPSDPEESAPTIEDETILGEANQEPAFTLDVTAPKKYIPGKKVRITVTVNNVNAETGLQHVHGKLYFNTDVLGFDFAFRANKELKKTFAGYNEWEGLSKLCVDAEGKWYIAVDAATSGVEDEETGEFVYSNVKESGVLVFNYTFVVKEEADGDAAVFIPHSTVIGDYYHPTTFAHTPYVGNGSGVVMIKETEPHVCDASGDWQYDKNNHWKLCSCLDELEKAAHELEWAVTTEATMDSEGEKQYKCKTCGYVAETEAIPATGLKGDVNRNGEIDSMDYVYLKRAYFGTYVIKDLKVADINNNNRIDSMDYVYLKRAYFGTYVIK